MTIRYEKDRVWVDVATMPRYQKWFSREKFGSDFKKIAEETHAKKLLEKSGSSVQSESVTHGIVSRQTFAELADRYVEEHLINTDSYPNKSYVEIAKRQWGVYRPHFMKKLLVRKWIWDLIRAKEFSPSSILKIVRYTQAPLNWAVENEIIDFSPLYKLVDRVLKDWFSENIESRKVTISEKDFMVMVEKFPAWLKRICLQSYYTGMRCGEICLTRWDNYAEEDLIVLTRKQTKEKRGKTIALPELIVNQIREIKAEQLMNGINSEYIYLSASGVPLVKVDQKGKVKGIADLVGGPFDRYSKKAGYEGITFHDLRRSWKNNQARAGKPLRAIEAQMGHSTQSSDDAYTVVSVDELRDLVR